MTLLHRDTEFDDAEDSRRLRGWRDHPRRYYGERPVIERHPSRRIWHGLTLLSAVVFVGLAMWRCVT